MVTIKEIDKYCSLCMDINCTGCEYHDVHFRNVKKKQVMAIIKSYTDLEQSKKLVTILPHESADMYYGYGKDKPEFLPVSDADVKCLSQPCWSLAALLSTLHFPQLSKDKLGSGKVGWMVSIYPNDCRYDSCWHENPIDACVELILKLNELNLL